MSRRGYRLVLGDFCRPMFVAWRRSTPMRSAEAHQTLYFKISFLQLLFFHHLPEIIPNDGIHVVLHHIIFYPSCQGSLPLNSFSCLINLHLQLLHMSAQSLKLCVQVCVDKINLPIKVHCHALPSLENSIKHLLNLALLSWRWWLLVVGASITPVVVVIVVVVVAVGFLVLRTLVEFAPISIGVSVSILVSQTLESSSTDEVHICFLCSTLCIYSLYIFSQADMLPEKLVNTVQLCLHLINLIIPKDGGRSLPLKISVLGAAAR
ncbi:hypothetical protein YC2023_082338 [Brassica napus]